MRLLTWVFAIFLLAFSHSSDLFADETGSTKIGVILPLTGQFAALGSALQNGIEMARSDKPLLFKNIKFLYEDSQYDPKVALSAYQKLQDVENVAVFFSFSSSSSIAIAPHTENRRMVLVHIGFEPEPGQGKKYVFRSMNYSEQYMRVLLDYLRSKSISHFRIIKTNLPFFESILHAFSHNLTTGESIETVESLDPSDTSLGLTVTKLKKNKIVEVGLFLTPPQISDLYKRGKEQNFRFVAFGTDVFESAARLAAPSALDGAVYPDNNVQEDFRARYVSAHGTDEHITFAGNAYDISSIIAQAIGSLQSMTGESIAAAIRNTPPGNGVLGQYSFRDDKEGGQYFDFPIVMKEIRGTRGVALMQPK